jgi:hypothetical protein
MMLEVVVVGMIIGCGSDDKSDDCSSSGGEGGDTGPTTPPDPGTPPDIKHNFREVKDVCYFADKG